MNQDDDEAKKKKQNSETNHKHRSVAGRCFLDSHVVFVEQQQVDSSGRLTGHGKAIGYRRLS